MKKFDIFKKNDTEKKRRNNTLELLDTAIDETEKKLEVVMHEISMTDPTETITLEAGQKGNKYVLKYDMLMKEAESLTKSLALLIDKQEAVTNPKKDFNTLHWYEKININDILKIGLVAGVSVLEVWGMVQLQQNGHLVGREWDRVRLPRI